MNQPDEPDHGSSGDEPARLYQMNLPDERVRDEPDQKSLPDEPDHFGKGGAFRNSEK